MYPKRAYCLGDKKTRIYNFGYVCLKVKPPNYSEIMCFEISISTQVPSF